MRIIDIIKEIVRGGGASPEKAAMDYCFAHGFTAGKNFHYNSGYPIDANWPWLISVGDDVTLSSNVRSLAHDASTVKVGAHAKIGIVKIHTGVIDVFLFHIFGYFSENNTQHTFPSVKRFYFLSLFTSL